MIVLSYYAIHVCISALDVMKRGFALWVFKKGIAKERAGHFCMCVFIEAFKVASQLVPQTS